MVCKLAQPLNAELPIAIKLFDSLIDCKYEQPSNALVSIYFTLLDI